MTPISNAKTEHKKKKGCPAPRSNPAAVRLSLIRSFLAANCHNGPVFLYQIRGGTSVVVRSAAYFGQFPNSGRGPRACLQDACVRE